MLAVQALRRQQPKDFNGWILAYPTQRCQEEVLRTTFSAVPGRGCASWRRQNLMI
jgi:hypothetical protein